MVFTLALLIFLDPFQVTVFIVSTLAEQKSLSRMSTSKLNGIKAVVNFSATLSGITADPLRVAYSEFGLSHNLQLTLTDEP